MTNAELVATKAMLEAGSDYEAVDDMLDAETVEKLKAVQQAHREEGFYVPTREELLKESDWLLFL